MGAVLIPFHLFKEVLFNRDNVNANIFLRKADSVLFSAGDGINPSNLAEIELFTAEKISQRCVRNNELIAFMAMAAAWKRNAPFGFIMANADFCG